MMITRVRLTALHLAAAFALLLLAGRAAAAAAPLIAPSSTPDPKVVLADVLRRWADVIEPPAGQAAPTFTTKLTVTKADGLPPEAAGASADIAFQAPERLRMTVNAHGKTYAAGRQGQQLWLHMPAEKFAILGTPDVPRFKRYPNEKDDTAVPLFALPGGRFLFSLLPVMVTTTLAPAEEVNGARCEVLKLTPFPAPPRCSASTSPRRPPSGSARATGSRCGSRSRSRAGGSTAQLDFTDAALVEPLAEERWSLSPPPATRWSAWPSGTSCGAMNVAPKLGRNSTPILGPATGERRVVATEGKGRLELIDGTRVTRKAGCAADRWWWRRWWWWCSDDGKDCGA